MDYVCAGKLHSRRLGCQYLYNHFPMPTNLRSLEHRDTASRQAVYVSHEGVLLLHSLLDSDRLTFMHHPITITMEAEAAETRKGNCNVDFRAWPFRISRIYHADHSTSRCPEHRRYDRYGAYAELVCR